MLTETSKRCAAHTQCLPWEYDTLGFKVGFQTLHDLIQQRIVVLKGLQQSCIRGKWLHSKCACHLPPLLVLIHKPEQVSSCSPFFMKFRTKILCFLIPLNIFSNFSNQKYFKPSLSWYGYVCFHIKVFEHVFADHTK